MVKQLGLLAFTLGAVTYAAAPLPNDSSYWNGTKWIDIDSRPAPLGGLGDGGGRFVGTVSTTNNSFSAGAVDTNFWCIDSQLTVSVPSAPGNANIFKLNAITTTNTQYANLTTDANFTNKTGNLAGFGFNERIKMAAYLVSSYDGGLDPDNTGRNQAIQGAIWAIIHNNINTSGQGGINTGGAITNEDYWISQAVTNRGTVDLNRWAVVSWVVSNTGDLSGTPDRQTFLVEVVPEPGFYGVLALGLSGLWFAVGRRKKA